MSLGPVVRCAGGLRVAQRGASPDAPADWRVGPIRSIRPPESDPIESRRFDLALWRRHWAEEKRLVIEYCDVVLVEIDDASGAVVFDRPLDDDMEQHLLLDHILPLVIARRGGVVLHGAVVSRDGKAAVLVGQSGAGKSTMTAFVGQQGWIIGGDDGAVVSTTPRLQVEPTYASVRLTPVSAQLLGVDTAMTSAIVGKMRVIGAAAEQFEQRPVELALIAFIEPVAAGEAATFDVLKGLEAHAQLFGATFHADMSLRFGLPSIMSGLAAIVGSAVIGRLGVPRGVAGLAAAEEVLRARLAAAVSTG